MTQVTLFFCKNRCSVVLVRVRAEIGVTDSCKSIHIDSAGSSFLLPSFSLFYPHITCVWILLLPSPLKQPRGCHARHFFCSPDHALELSLLEELIIIHLVLPSSRTAQYLQTCERGI